MNKFLVFLLVFVLATGLVGSASAHKALIIGDYKMDVGWKKEPPIANEPNAIEIEISIASDFDKQRDDKIPLQPSFPSSESAITGLANDLEVDIKIGSGEKSFLSLIEDPEISGVYYGDYTPQESGATKIHIYGKIQGSEFEATFHPEKVTQNIKTEQIVIPDWIRNNAKWWSEGMIENSDFVSGIEYLVKNHILDVPVVQQEITETKEIPSWIKNNAGWWADKLISDEEFVKGIQYMITNGIIVV
ncbi:MAG: peptidase [Nitrosopumilales archaeon CG15_BIG_FIL_POST_REV_8_21_14_020_33_23]|nr:MAG: peptidase [Nitrosopumilus sp. CG10_big_fil_rev_8_21_14_0_10_33_7]PIW35037.1 MAG: peptidase [Nitrosopumilales archaeon CG15_BIG_FIL_POST_REV_8_21_14_020_33_23]PIY90200.1 MAG: peptidase [Nitrosopumilales archaeon CG_4_10_14_0_8_um_filter_34_8]PJB97516.1 MAG: peptidase [Nitrosopumilales archaeon CG_4_9_14_0_8_um_filter_34_10]